MIELTEKNEAIDKLLTRLNPYHMVRIEAIQRNICIWCQDDVKHFRDKRSEKEYLISGLCQSCQDIVFSKEE